MMDDLISRKALIEKLDEWCGSQTYLISEEVWKIIKNSPKAFDKEKVTQELKSNMESAQLAQSLVGTDLVQCGGFSYGYYNGVKDAVKIVEKGGIE